MQKKTMNECGAQHPFVGPNIQQERERERERERENQLKKYFFLQTLNDLRIDLLKYIQILCEK